ncbi:MAG: hypothetical protein NTW99_07410 [Chloroflexi bacterium]|nr:hypothetical protein [Chloroflexota bacterium]
MNVPRVEQYAAQHPDDPEAQVNVALAYWNANLSSLHVLLWRQDLRAGYVYQLYQSKPDMPEAHLLQAEFDAKTGQPDAARRALTQRRNSPAGKGWMLSEAAKIEGTIP